MSFKAEILKINGTGDLSPEGHKTVSDVSIRITLFQNSRLEIILSTGKLDEILPVFIQNQLLYCSFEGTDQSNRKIKISKFYVKKSSMPMKMGEPVLQYLDMGLISKISIEDSNLPDTNLDSSTCGIYNLVFTGPELVQYGTIVRSARFRTTIVKEPKNLELVFTQKENYQDVINALNADGNNGMTCDLKVEKISLSLNEWDKFLEKIMLLLSYASKCYITFSHQNVVFENGKKALYIYAPLTKEFASFRLREFVQKDIHQNDLGDFLTCTFQNMENYYDSLSLNRFLHGVVKSENTSIIDVKFLFLSSIIDGLTNKIVNHFNLPNPNFKGRITEVLNYYSIPYNESIINDIKNDRNSIVHEFNFRRTTFQDKMNVLLELQILLDQILFSILGFTGRKIWSYKEKMFTQML